MNTALSRRKVLVAALGAGSATGASAQAEDSWVPVRPLLGDWAGTSSGRPGQSVVTRTYAFVIGGKYILETNVSVYPPQERNPKGERHEHWGFISYDRVRKTLVLRQFHVEGFVNTYRHAPDSASTALTFESESFENFNNSWRARESYAFSGANEFVEVFELAPPGKEFEVYSRTQFKRART